MPAMQSPPPLSDKDTYTSWPGGVDPSARLYARGGKRRRAATRRGRRNGRKTRRAGRR